MKKRLWIKSLAPM